MPRSARYWNLRKRKENLNKVQESCRSINTVLNNMKTGCGATVSKEGKCETVYLDSYASDLTDTCNALAAAEAEDPPDEEKIAQLTQQRDALINNFDQGQLDNTFNVDVSGNGPGSNNFFSETENTGWLDSLGSIQPRGLKGLFNKRGQK